MSRSTPGRGVVGALVRLAPVGLAVLLQTLWLVNLRTSDDPLAVVRRDWHQYFTTGRHLLSGELGAIYPRVFDLPFPWMYPPYCIYATAPLALLPEAWAYVACAAMVCVGTVGALLLLRAAVPASLGAYAFAAAVVLASMPFNTALMLGQASGLFALVLAAGLWAWRRGHRFLAGLFLSLMMAKPNLGVVFVVLCLAAREWRVLAGIATGFGILLLGSLPLGLDVWQDYLRATRDYVPVVETRTLMWKQLTLYAFWRTVPGLGGGHGPTVVALWLATVVPLGLVTLSVWWRYGGDERLPLERAFGVAVLFAISANFYTQFYDGLLLMIPGVIWYVGRRDYRSRASHAVIGLCILLLFVGGHLTMFVVQRGVAWSGPLIAVWLCAEAYDLLATRASSVVEGGRGWRPAVAGRRAGATPARLRVSPARTPSSRSGRPSAELDMRRSGVAPALRPTA